MKKSFLNVQHKIAALLLTVLFLNSNVLFAEERPSIFSPKQEVIEFFLKAQEKSSTLAEERLIHEIDLLAKEKFTVRVGSDAILLSESCGYLGCVSTYMVSTNFMQRNSMINPQTKSVVGIVRFQHLLYKLTLSKVLTIDEIDGIINLW